MHPALTEDLIHRGAEPQGEWFAESFGLDDVEVDDSGAECVEEGRDGDTFETVVHVAAHRAPFLLLQLLHMGTSGCIGSPPREMGTGSSAVISLGNTTCGGRP
jgi:hypothetical protein